MQKFLKLAGISVVYKNIYGARMLLRGDIGKEYFVGFGELGTLSILDRFLREGDVFVDVGAYVGFFSLYASYKVGNSGEVICFEPNPESYKVLMENLKINGINNVRAFNFALGSKECFLELTMPHGKTPSESTLMEEEGKKFKVKVVRFDDIINELGIERVSMIKIDVEGWENEVIGGMIKTIEKFKPIILVEKNPLLLLGYNYLIDIGYKPLILEGTKSHPSDLKVVSNYDDVPLYDNILFVWDRV